MSREGIPRPPPLDIASGQGVRTHTVQIVLRVSHQYFRLDIEELEDISTSTSDKVEREHEQSTRISNIRLIDAQDVGVRLRGRLSS